MAKYNQNTCISVIMPVRQGRYLAEAVASLCRQTHSKQQIIIIDDGCARSDLNQVCGQDARIEIIPNQGAGLIDALNTGLANVSGELVARMDADDIALPERLGTQMQLLNRLPDRAIVAGRVEIFRTDGVIDQGYHLYQQWINSLITPEDIARDIFIESPLPHPTVLMPRSLSEALGKYRDGEFPEDYDYWLRARAEGAVFAKPEAVLLRWRDESDRTSRNDSRYQRLAFMHIKADYVNELAGGRDLYIWGTGQNGLALHDSLIQKGNCVAGFIDVHPRRVGQLKRSIPVLPISEVASIAGLVLVAVSARGVREEVRAFMQAHGKTETRDYWFFA